MKAQEVMSSQVVSVTPDATILHAARLMLQHRFSGLPVVDAGGKLLGIVSEGDFLRRTETGTVRRRPRWVEFFIGPGPLAAEYTHAAGRRVADVMTRDVVTVTEETELQDVVALMERHRVKRLPVLRNGRLVGIVTRQNLLRALIGRISTIQPLAEDAAIREHLLAELARHSWAPSIDVSVEKGRVKLSGTIFDGRQREAVHVAAQSIPGVKGIEDEIIWIEPMSGTVIDSRVA
jgi:CBS domain-containing protein